MLDLIDLIRSSEKAVLCHIPSSSSPLDEPFIYAGNDLTIFGLSEVKTINELLSHVDDKSESAQGIGVDKFHATLRSYFSPSEKKSNERTFLLPLLTKRGRIDVLANLYIEKDEMFILFLLLEYGDGLPDFESYIHTSYKDRLTGLFNYQTLREHMRNNNKSGYLCLFDLNKFKEINDNYGHHVGDEVLVALSNYLISIATMEEGFYRRSGDEFFILYFGKYEELAKKMINDIDNRLKGLSKNELKECPGLECSASFGVVELNYEDEEGIDYEDYLKLADLAMYQAKISHKQMHWISYDDAKYILHSGTLDKRLKEVLSKAKR